jgi:hypothetical protein
MEGGERRKTEEEKEKWQKLRSDGEKERAEEYQEN